MANNNPRTFTQGIWHPNLTDPMVDIRHGGQFGWSMDYQNLINATPYVSTQMFCIVMQSPRGFDKLGGNMATTWHESWKALFELHALSIEGLDKTLNPEVGSTPIGGSGEEFEVPTGMTRAKSEVTFNFNEKTGLVITHMLEQFHRTFIMDEDTKHPGIALITDEIGDGLADFYSWTMMFIEPDKYLRYPVRAWMVSNMFPKGSAPQQSKRDKASQQETLDISVPMTGIAQVGYGVDAVARVLLQSVKRNGHDPQRAPAHLTERSAELKDAPQGFVENMETLHSQMVQAP